MTRSAGRNSYKDIWAG